MAVEEDAEDIVGGESDEQTSVAASGSGKRTDEKYKAEANEISRTRNEAAGNGKLVLDRESGRKERKRETQNQILG